MPRGCHIVTRELLKQLPEIAEFQVGQPSILQSCCCSMHVSLRQRTAASDLHGHVQVGLCNLFVQHTSASLTINENASPDVPLDLNVRLAIAYLCALKRGPNRHLVGLSMQRRALESIQVCI